MFRTSLAVAVVSAAVATAAPTTFNPATGFGPANAPFSYGSTLGGAFSPLPFTPTGAQGQPPLAGFAPVPTASSYPFIIQNNTNSPYSYADITVPAAGSLVLHPGGAGEQATVRFTAPFDATLNVSGAFGGLSGAGTTTDVQVLLNGVPVESGNINGGASSTVPFNLSALPILAGQTLDFRVGTGGNGFANDSTTLAVTITATPVPEPATAAAVGLLGLAAVGARRLRRRAG